MKTLSTLALALILAAGSANAGTTNCQPDFMGGMRCTTFGDFGGGSSTTHCRPDFMGGFRCTDF